MEETPPNVNIQSVTTLEGNTNQTISLNIGLSKAIDENVTLSYRTQDGTAIAGEDYEAITNGEVTIEPGFTTTSISVTILGDDELELDETFEVILVNAENANLSNARATVTIRNDDDGTGGNDSDEGYRTPISYAGYRLVSVRSLGKPTV